MFRIEIETCEHCGGPVRVIACIEDPPVIEKILTHIERRNTAVASHSEKPRRGAGASNQYNQAE